LLKILFIHEVSYRKKVIFEMHEFPELLALRGHAKSPSWNLMRVDDSGRNRTPQDLTSIKGRVHGNATIRLSRPFQIGIPGIDRILAPITMIPVLRRLLRENNFDAVVLYAVPTYGLQTLWLAKSFKVPVVSSS
jgi:hypothetical protein